MTISADGQRGEMMAEYIMIEVADETGVFADVRKPLIRCKDCIRWRRSKSNTAAMVCDWDSYEKTENDFCSWAVRKDNDTR